MKTYIKNNLFNILFYGGIPVVIALVLYMGINNAEVLNYYH